MPKYTNAEFNTWYGNEARAALAAQGFEAVRTEWKKGFRDQKAQLRYMAESALENFAKSGDNTRLNLVLDDLRTDGRNVLRPAAFVKWCVDHQPLKYEDDKLMKDKAAQKDQQEYDALMIEALAIPYWDHAPDKEMEQFGADDLVKALEAVLKRFTGKKYKPKNEAAANELAQATAKVAELRRIVPIETLIAATPASAQVHKSEASQSAVAADIGCEVLEVAPLAATEAKVA